ncbi:CGI-121-domain-containing protein [Aureobasidium sp. EXF-3400]|nr:CGI-121-domain-containing protein [Aureobasidium sp. EXF-12344]KAI4780754.1 CGI-121-domain-containing protein [Aureobasidium sp. EXF-3400]
MSTLETIALPHLPQYPLCVGLFKDVKNASFLRQQLLAGNADFEYAFLDASVVITRMQFLAASFRGINDFASNRMKSHNVHSEIVFSFSPNNNIAESFRRFGISDTTQHVLAIKVLSSGITTESVSQHLQQNIEGDQVDVSDANFAELADQARLRKIYKLNSQTKKGPANGTTSKDAEIKELETSILGVMALKDS